MKNKKLLSTAMAVAMAATLMSGCGNKGQDSSTTAATTAATEATTKATEATTQEATTEPTTEVTEPAVEGEALPDPVYYYSFDEADGNDGIQVTAQDTAATPILSAAEGKEVVRIPGVKGEAVYLDGKNGLKLTDVNGVGDTYTVSYWMYATRFSNYMPTIQFGPDVHGDVTGGQHYLNLTRTEWNPDGAAFPCVWSYDGLNTELVNNWPAWASPDATEHLKEWVNVTLVVDASKPAASDPNCFAAQLYLNGQELVNKDADGNVVEIVVVPGTMAPSDNFDFLVGVNYWDAIFKGAFDEVYVFDQALTAGQALTLYQQGDPSVAFEEPEREIVITPNEAAIDTIGTVDLDNNWWTDWTESYELKDGETKEVVLKNYSDGLQMYDNYVTVFTNDKTEAGVDPNTSEGHVEYGVFRADCYSWGNADYNWIANSENAADDTVSFNWTWDNWKNWQESIMVEADVVLKISRNGGNITVAAEIKDFNGTVYTSTSSVESTIKPEDPVYFFLTGEHSYVEVLSVGDAREVVADANAIDHIGNTDLTGTFWSDWTAGTEIADGATKTVKLTNFTAGNNNWENFVLAFCNTPTEAHVAPASQSEGYAEYAVLRADAYGWGDASYAGEFTTDWEDGQWADWLNMMKDADVTIVISRDGGTLNVDYTFVGADGKEWKETAKVTSLLTAADPCYFFFTNEACYNDILSIE